MTARTPVVYAREQQLDVEEFRQVLVESGLGATRPVNDPQRLRAMLSGANLIVTARLKQTDSPLVALARCSTDFAWNCYLSELAVSASTQGLGIGQGLMDEVRRQIGPKVSLILTSMPDAVGFYERMGMQRMNDVFWYRREQ
jgi:ribosomal protein S18 acetylase RimI-like enzyme